MGATCFADKIKKKLSYIFKEIMIISKYKQRMLADSKQPWVVIFTIDLIAGACVH